MLQHTFTLFFLLMPTPLPLPQTLIRRRMKPYRKSTIRVTAHLTNRDLRFIQRKILINIFMELMLDVKWG